MGSTDTATVMAKLLRGIAHARRNEHVRLAIFASIAATLAFLVSSVAPVVSGVVAAITALLTTRTTFHESIQEGGKQVIGTIAGAVVGGLLLASMGFSPLLLVVSLAVAFGIGRLLRLGEEGSITIGVTVILVLGLNLGGAAVESRVLGVIAGAAIALTLSQFVMSEPPHDRAMRRAIAYTQEISSLLADIGGALRRRSAGLDIPSTLIAGWLTQAQEVQNGLAALITETEEIVKGSRWSPLIQREEAERVLAQCVIGHELSMTVSGMCRELLATQESVSLSDTLALHLSEVFDAAANVVEGQAHQMLTADEARQPSRDEDLKQLIEAHESARDKVKSLDDTGAIILGGSLLQDGATIGKIATGDEPWGQSPTLRP